MKYFRRETPDEAIKALTDHLKIGLPCILSVDNWEHWFTVINEQQGKFADAESLYETVARNNPNSPLGSEAALHAVQLRAKLPPVTTPNTPPTSLHLNSQP